MINPPNESTEQQKLIQWLRLKKIFHFSVPNGSVLKGTPLQRAKQMARLKKEGLVVGVSDVVVMLPNKILFIELKRARKTLKSGKLSISHTKTSPEQLKFLESVVENFDYADGFVCYGAKQAIEYIESFKL